MISVPGVKKVSSRGKGTLLRRALSTIVLYLYDCGYEVSGGIKVLIIVLDVGLTWYLRIKGSYELQR